MLDNVSHTSYSCTEVPFPVEIPNEETLIVFHESEEGKGLVECKDADDMFTRLGV